ncbi:MAG TPA: antibiotic biosynthesis monooxygenase [Ktedonobacterales bacterium]
MYAAIRRGKVKLEKADEVIQHIRESVLPLVRKTPGFLSLYAVRIGEDEIITVSIFETQAGADESSTVAAEWVRTHIAPLLAGPLDISSGEVAIHA